MQEAGWLLSRSHPCLGDGSTAFSRLLNAERKMSESRTEQ